MFAGSLEVRPCHLFQHGGQGGHITALCAQVPAGRIQDVASMHHQQQHVRFAFSLAGGGGFTERSAQGEALMETNDGSNSSGKYCQDEDK